MKDEEYEVKQHHLIPGTLLKERYEVGRVIGEGGFGITYAGRDTLLDMKIAVKEFYMNGYVNRNNATSLRVSSISEEHGELFEINRDKYLNEARVLAKFSGEEGIVDIRDFFEENNTAYIVMEYLTGRSLKETLDEVKSFGWRETLEILKPVLNSLKAVHEQNVIHRDISPDNIIITDDNKVKLLDFGAAREIIADDDKSLSVILRPGYAPEEQYRRKGVQGPWTDIYALCATMYQCITGIAPENSVDRIYEDELKSPAEICENCSIAVSNIIMRGMSIRQNERYHNIEELQADIEKALANPDDETISGNTAESAEAREDGKTDKQGNEQSGKTRLKWVIIAGCIVAAGIIIWAVARNNSNSGDTVATTESAAETVTVAETGEDAGSSESADETVPEESDTYMTRVCFDFKEDYTDEEKEEALDVIKIRLNNLLPNQYTIMKLEDHYELTFPCDAIPGTDFTRILRYHVFMPDELYLANNSVEYYKLDRQNIESAEVIKGKIEGITLSESDSEELGDEDYTYLEIKAGSDAAGQIAESISEWQNSDIGSGFNRSIIALEDYGESSSDIEEIKETEFKLSAYTDLDMYLDGRISEAKLWKSSYVSVSPDGSAIDLLLVGGSDKEYEQMAANLTSERNCPDVFDCFYEIPAVWETPDNLLDTKVIWGQNQVKADYFRNEDLSGYDMVFTSYYSDESYGEWFDNRTNLTECLDDIGINYAVGMLANKEYSIVIRIPAKYAGEEFTKALRGNLNLEVSLYDSVKAGDVPTEETKNERFPSLYTVDLSSMASHMIMEQGEIKVFLKPEDSAYEAELTRLKEITDRIPDYEENCSIRWGNFFGRYDEKDRAFIFDKSVYSLDESIPDECEYLIKLINYRLNNRNDFSYSTKSDYIDYAETNASMEAMKEGRSDIISDKSDIVVGANLKNKLVTQLGMEPTMKYSKEFSSCTIDLMQDISEDYAVNLFRITDSISDAALCDYDGVFTFPERSTLRMDFFDMKNEKDISRVNLSRWNHTITIVFWTENVPEEELLEEQLFKLKDMFKNDPEFKDYDVSITKVTQS